MRMSTAEAVFVVQADQSQTVRHYVREYRFAPRRRWRFDFAWPPNVAMEIEGGRWTGGRHTRPVGFAADLEKYNWATRLGWQVYRFTTEQVMRGEALAWMEDILTHGRREAT